MKANGAITKRMGKVPSGTAEVISTSVSSKWIKHMASVFTSIPMDPDMRASGIETFKKDRVRRYGLTAPNTLAITWAG